MDLAQFDALVGFVRGKSSTIDRDHVNVFLRHVRFRILFVFFFFLQTVVKTRFIRFCDCFWPEVECFGDSAGAEICCKRLVLPNFPVVFRNQFHYFPVPLLFFAEMEQLQF
uniref:(northern house mosquito) hypothetical protein n=1 Tax=Culex pipiens TaxID=7175 RepID=A0A8D8CGN3_CULPI